MHYSINPEEIKTEIEIGVTKKRCNKAPEGPDSGATGYNGR
jgi:hypothetical protein